GITARTADDCALVLNVLAEPDGTGESHDFYRDASNNTRLRVGVADNFTADKEVLSAFETAVEMIRALGHDILAAKAPLDMPPFGDLHSIESDRRTIADRAFKQVDILLLPTTATAVLSVK